MPGASGIGATNVGRTRAAGPGRTPIRKEIETGPLLIPTRRLGWGGGYMISPMAPTSLKGMKDSLEQRQRDTILWEGPVRRRGKPPTHVGNVLGSGSSRVHVHARAHTKASEPRVPTRGDLGTCGVAWQSEPA